jgi:hypothetical protein
MTGQSVNVAEICATEECDTLLAVAGLKPRWQPDSKDLNPSIESSAYDVDFLSGLDKLNEYEEKVVQQFCVQAVEVVRSKFIADVSGSFRAASAISARAGNCMAHHEALSGVLSYFGFERQVVGIWRGYNSKADDGNHATTGIMLGNSYLHVDGYDKKVMFRSLSEKWIEAIEGANSYGTATLIEEIDGCDRILESNVTPSRLSELSLKQLHWNERRSIVMPAATAVLMYSAVFAVNSTSPKYERAMDILAPYAPAFK